MFLQIFVIFKNPKRQDEFLLPSYHLSPSRSHCPVGGFENVRQGLENDAKCCPRPAGEVQQEESQESRIDRNSVRPKRRPPTHD